MPVPPFLTELDEAARADLLGRAGEREWEAGDHLVRSGEPGASVLLITSGRVKVETATEQRAVLLTVCGPGELVGEVSAVEGATRSANVVAMEDGAAAELSAAGLQEHLAIHPQTGLILLTLVTARLRGADLQRMQFATAPSFARIASRLVELADRFGVPNGDGVVIDLPMSQDELASWSAASRESTMRALRSLRELGLVETSRRQFSVRDLAALRAHAAQV